MTKKYSLPCKQGIRSDTSGVYNYKKSERKETETNRIQDESVK
jgi:hypothetical protein